MADNVWITGRAIVRQHDVAKLQKISLAVVFKVGKISIILRNFVE